MKTAYRQRVQRFTAVVAVGAVALGSSLGAVDKDKAVYVGGTITSIPEKAEGQLRIKAETALEFDGDKDGSATIPWEAITALEYGQKAGRRVAVGILVSPIALFSKKRNHFLTITFKDAAGKEQAGVFELGKDTVRTTLKVLEVRTGKDIEFQDVEACKQYRTPKDCEAAKG